MWLGGGNNCRLHGLWKISEEMTWNTSVSGVAGESNGQYKGPMWQEGLGVMEEQSS